MLPDIFLSPGIRWFFLPESENNAPDAFTSVKQLSTQLQYLNTAIYIV